jgi:hypothetical protein
VSLLKTSTAFGDSLEAEPKKARLPIAAPDTRRHNTFWLIPCNSDEPEGHATFTRCAIRTLLCVAALPAISEEAGTVHDRVFLSRAEIESVLVGKAIVSNNLATGMISHWHFHLDGRVDFANRSGPGSASGKWVLNPDGAMCVTMVSRTRCRYWFRKEKDGSLANADSREPNAPTVAEIRFE